MTASIIINGKQQFIDLNGHPLVGGKVFFYVPNTSTLKNTWQDMEQATLNTNPVLLDARGQALIFGVGNYRQVVKDINDNVIWDVPTSAVGAGTDVSDSTVTPTGGTTPQSLKDQLQSLLTPMNFGAVGDGVADDGAALEAAFTYSATSGVLIGINRSYATKRELYLRDNAGIWCFGNARIIGDMTGAPTGFTVLSLATRHIRGTIKGYLTLETDSEANCTKVNSRLLRLGQASGTNPGAYDANMQCHVDTVYLGKGAYTQVSSNQECDLSTIDALVSFEKTGGPRVDFNMQASNAEAPSACLQIGACHFSYVGGPGDCPTGLQIIGTDSVHIKRVIINNHDVNFNISSPSDGPRRENIAPLFESIYSEERRPFATRYNAWGASTGYGANSIILPTSANGYCYISNNGGVTGASQPTWPTVIGNTVVDGGITWRCLSKNAGNWVATKAYTLGMLVRGTPANARGGLILECTTAGTSGGTEPDWSTVDHESRTSTIVDGTVTWTAKYRSIFYQGTGQRRLHTLLGTINKGHIACFVAQGAGRYSLTGCETPNLQSPENVDISFSPCGFQQVDGAIYTTICKLRGNFRIYRSSAGEAQQFNPVLHRTEITADTAAHVNTDGLGDYFGSLVRPTAAQAPFYVGGPATFKGDINVGGNLNGVATKAWQSRQIQYNVTQGTDATLTMTNRPKGNYDFTDSVRTLQIAYRCANVNPNFMYTAYFAVAYSRAGAGATLQVLGSSPYAEAGPVAAQIKFGVAGTGTLASVRFGTIAADGSTLQVLVRNEAGAVPGDAVIEATWI